jgi:ATPase subunit of ABC transporter with duplicated ATPase domains
MAEFIYTMKKVRKAHGDKVILDDVTLSFFPGAKIGVVGPNGAGKSSVLRIMAGLDKPNNGEAFLATGATVGMLQQEPPLNEEKTVRGNVEEGLGDIKVKLDRFNQVAELMATDYSDDLMEEMGRLQEELDHADAWDLDAQLEQAMDALRCPPPDDPVTNLSGGERRRVAPRLPPTARSRTTVSRSTSPWTRRCYKAQVTRTIRLNGISDGSVDA